MSTDLLGRARLDRRLDPGQLRLQRRPVVPGRTVFLGVVAEVELAGQLGIERAGVPAA
ncbi:hypothetical protein [Streptomyces swartbergensis]|uniref:hypothetical protein n=1 Tax=Streptomyces swartbergensis TaxID=487165 RepID=UPI00130289C7|nr:hypothetical protein [Streptomyces swartbergensis]